MRADGLSRAILRSSCRAPWSAVAVTEHVFTMTRFATSAEADVAPLRRNAASIASESAVLTRQPNVTMA